MRDQRRYDTDVSVPCRIGAIDCDLERDIEARTPLLEQRAKENLAWIAHSHEDCHLPVKFSVGQDVIDGWAQRRKAESTGNEHNVASPSLLYRPRSAIGTA